MSAVSIADVVNRHLVGQDARPLINDLVEREEGLADMLRMAGIQFGLYPQIVSEVLASVEMGAPMESPQRDLIHAQFVALMEELQRQHGQH
jgi:hypothetical protein